MNRFAAKRIGPLGLLGAWALALASPAGALAGFAAPAPPGISSPPVTVQQTGDPTNVYTVSDVTFNTAPTDPTTQLSQYFAPNADLSNPTNYFTISGFAGTFAGLPFNGFNLPNFDFVGGIDGGTAIEIVYDPSPSMDLPATTPTPIEAINLGSLEFKTSGPAPLSTTGTLTFTYFDEANLKTGGTGGNTGSNPVSIVPEPSSIALLALGALGGLHFRRRMTARTA